MSNFSFHLITNNFIFNFLEERKKSCTKNSTLLIYFHARNHSLSSLIFDTPCAYALTRDKQGIVHVRNYNASHMAVICEGVALTNGR